MTMEFKIKEYKKDEFFSTIAKFADEGKFNPGMIEFTPENDGFVTASIHDSVITKLSQHQLETLKTI